MVCLLQSALHCLWLDTFWIELFMVCLLQSALYNIEQYIWHPFHSAGQASISSHVVENPVLLFEQILWSVELGNNSCI